MHTVSSQSYSALRITLWHFSSQGSLKPLIKDSITYFNLSKGKNTSNYNWLPYLSEGFATDCQHSLPFSGLAYS